MGALDARKAAVTRAPQPTAGCLFCRIAAGDEPAVIVADLGDVLVVANRFPAVEGALLVLPRAHHETVVDIPEHVAARLFAVATRAARALLDADGIRCEGVNVHHASGAIAGQRTVSHFHLLVSPRYEGDGVVLPLRGAERTADELEATATSIRSAFARGRGGTGSA